VKYPNNARGIAKFNVPLAHMMFAGSDFIIVPSRFEPCGLIQLQGMRYGVVRVSSSLCYSSDLSARKINISSHLFLSCYILIPVKQKVLENTA
jgi:granule-bound starch synthase